MKNNRANRHNDRGFTLSEVLLTVAILVVLFALLFFMVLCSSVRYGATSK